MKLTRLRIVGFKTFVEPADVPIEPGLTGIVGPNGCGKSNLVEALRWVMGESSHKNLRAADMEEMIFAGSKGRAARNNAEVCLAVDNAARTAPQTFNDDDVLEITRRIERGQGSSYRINGREARARDVQTLFADAATGARSASMVRQGQIGEIIAAKPQARRRILEDAAGIGGLQSRRSEAELRLKAADDNLARVDDILREIETRIDALKRQTRQAARYRILSGEIRRLEALLHVIEHCEASAETEGAERQTQADAMLLAERALAQTETAKHQAIAAHALPPLREKQAFAAAAYQRLKRARSEREAEERRAADKTASLERRIAEIEADLHRQRALRADSDAALSRLEAEQADMLPDTDEARHAECEAARDASEAALAEAEAKLETVQARLSDLNARRSSLKRKAQDEGARAEKYAAEADTLSREREGLAGQAGAAFGQMGDELASARAALQDAETIAAAARQALAAARDTESHSRARLTAAERTAQSLEIEAATLAKLFVPDTLSLCPPLLDDIMVEKGFETALGAALGEDLDAPPDFSAPVHWAETGEGASDPALPEGVISLAEKVDSHPVLTRRLRQIGVVARGQGPRLRLALKPGQRLVSKEGDLWRWDGYTAAAEAPSAAAHRLGEKNRLGDLEREASAVRKAADTLRQAFEAAQAQTRAAAQAEAEALDIVKAVRHSLDNAHSSLAIAEKRESDRAARQTALEETILRLKADEAEARIAADEAEKAVDALKDAPALDEAFQEARRFVAEKRAAASESRAVLQMLVREEESLRKRRTALAAERESWSERSRRACEAEDELKTRLETARQEHSETLVAPEEGIAYRRALDREIDRAEAAAKTAAEAVTEAETALAAADRTTRAALENLAQAREAKAGSDARLDAARRRLAQIVQAIEDRFACSPAALSALAGPSESSPSTDETEQRLATLKLDRERLGGVNLRAEEELAEIEAKHQALIGERDDLLEAIKRLRQAVLSLNREGRERLLRAFETVNAHFQTLFAALFGGGAAELSLIESEDPLEAGLDIVAAPPGKKPQTMTLLSGGEQALTAIALIFAVFLTNPSPICVLDEVDAPLDDANVERYCDLLDAMARRTETRFLVITHNPITMARMHRLFGVTMVEQGVSQLVSVDLERAEQLREAG